MRKNFAINFTIARTSIFMSLQWKKLKVFLSLNLHLRVIHNKRINEAPPTYGNFPFQILTQLLIALSVAIAHAAPSEISLHNEYNERTLLLVSNWTQLCQHLCR